MNKGWIYVLLTSLFEVVWVTLLKTADSVLDWVIIALIAVVDFKILIKACDHLPTGTVYAVFAGFGAVGAVLIDWLFFDGQITVPRLFFVFLMVLAVIGLNLIETRQQKERKA